MSRLMFFMGLPTSLALIGAGCSSAATPQKISQIKPAMKIGQVEAILGRPDHIDQAETTGLRGEVYHYASSGGEGQVIFLNDVVFQAEFVPEGKP